ncbi:histone-lysine N-methyltransferase SETMAR-like [Contarinia nasturtii]|uniref:histone-lysine N-methyltransferase SETMAR-like n=1 Tax=Contarinia nasturtii TaxID=265458 RepID=UPI0012D3DD9A|nr:histone-lysine N-methyltransferase SETMAR-like [Contarinia nasturtii]
MNTVEAKEWLDKCYGICSPPSSTIKYWFAEFRRGRTSTADAERSGRPKEAIIPEIIQQVRRMLLNDRKVKVREIAESIDISTGSVVTIMHQHLHMKKLLAMWVPHFLNIDQKEQRINDSQRCLALYNRNPREFLRRYITMDETWVHHYVPQDKRQSAEWVGPDERPPKRVKQDRWAGKKYCVIS